MSEPEYLAGPHWRFALGVYRRRGVSEGCLLLQDQCGVDVNVLLVTLHASICLGRKVDQAAVECIDAIAREIRSTVVEPLRSVRRTMKGAEYGPATEWARGKVKLAELAAEQLEQSLLAAAAADLSARVDAPCSARETARIVLDHFAASSNAEPSADVQRALDTIAAAAEEEAGNDVVA